MQDDSYLLLRFSMSSGCPTQSNVSCIPAPWKGKKPSRPVLRASAATDVGACVSFNYATVAPPSADEEVSQSSDMGGAQAVENDATPYAAEIKQNVLTLQKLLMDWAICGGGTLP